MPTAFFVGNNRGFILADLNLCVFTGRLGRDPEIRYLSNGDASCNSSIAVGKKWKDKNSGEQKESTTWVSLSFYGKVAELFCKYCVKGSQVRVTGEFSVRKYTPTGGGEEKTITEIKVQDLQLLGGRQDGAGAGAPAAAPRAAAPAPRPAAAKPASGFDDMDDDIPF